MGVAAAMWASGASAAEPWFAWDAPPGCPAAEAVLERVRGVDKGATGDDITARVHVEAESADHWTARVEITVAGVPWERALDGTSCEAIADATALIVGLSETALPAAAHAPAPPPAPSPAPAPAPVLSLAPAPREAPAAVAPRVPYPGGFSVRASALLDSGALPSPSPGASVGVAWRKGLFEVGIDAAAFLAERGTASGSESGASVALGTAALDACLVVPLADCVVATPCAGLGLELLAADGFGPASTFVAAQPVVVLPAGLGEAALEWRAFPRVAFRASARGLVPFTRPTFVVRGPAMGDVRDVHRPAAIAAEPSLGVALLLGK